MKLKVVFLILFLTTSSHAQGNSGYYADIRTIINGQVGTVSVYFPTPEVRVYDNDIVVMGGNGKVSGSGYGCNGRFVVVRDYLTRDGRVYSFVRPQPGVDNEFSQACEAAGGGIHYLLIVDPHKSTNKGLYWDQLLCTVKLPKTLPSALCAK